MVKTEPQIRQLREDLSEHGFWTERENTVAVVTVVLVRLLVVATTTTTTTAATGAR